MEHATRVTVTIEVVTEWHQDDVGGSSEELDDMENQITDEDIDELVRSQVYNDHHRVTAVRWDNIWYPDK